jgi:hypothetical protein
VPKLLASVTLAAPFIAVSAIVTSYLAYLGDTKAVAAVTLSALAAVAMYAAGFVWLGLLTTQAIFIGLLYVVVWEGFFSGFVEGVRLLSVRYYAIALMHGLDERRFSWMSHLPLGAAVAIAFAIVAGFTLFSIRRLRRVDVP